jgi:four helix bundle protein
MIKNYRDLIVWQKSLDLVDMIYDFTASFPATEVYGLTNQLRRAGVSIPSNIAEGHARQSTQEFKRFLSIARGSLAEVETQLIIANRRNYLSTEKLEETILLTDEISKMLVSLMKRLGDRG